MSILSTVPKGAAVEGINPNLLRNWYFVGGGTGRGVFPVNSRGVTSGQTWNYYGIDGWIWDYGGTAGVGTYSIMSNGVKLTPASSASGVTARIVQIPDNHASLDGKKITASVLLSDGTLKYGTITRTNNTNQTIQDDEVFGIDIRIYSNVRFIAKSELILQAAKLELGDQQTLAHQENGVWVLNEIPDYEEEYYRCITSDADSTDTYANQKVSNITVQCNSVGSTSLRYYNKLIQSTHKVLDSTFSNPAAQTSDITVTTYDGYLDFSNGFASGATTNITLVLGTSGPVLSTSTTAPS